MPRRPQPDVSDIPSLPDRLLEAGVLPASIAALAFVVGWLVLFSQVNVLLGTMLADNANPWLHAAFYFIFVMIVAATVAVASFYYWRLSNPPRTQVTPPHYLDYARETLTRRRFRYKVIMEDHELQRVNDLTQRVFGDHRPDWNRIWNIFARNNRKSVVLVEYKLPNAEIGHGYDQREIYLAKSGGRGEIRAFAAAWPLTDEAGERMARGHLNEEQIEVEEVLPAAANPDANYLYITGIADIGSRAWQKHAPGLGAASSVSSAIVTVGLLDLLTAEFFRDNRPRHVIMIKDTAQGGNLIDFFTRRLPPDRVRTADIMQAGEPSTVTTVTVTAGEVQLARELLLRRLAGVQEDLGSYGSGEGFWH
jgi:hypothetical protein